MAGRFVLADPCFLTRPPRDRAAREVLRPSWPGSESRPGGDDCAAGCRLGLRRSKLNVLVRHLQSVPWMPSSPPVDPCLD